MFHPTLQHHTYILTIFFVFQLKSCIILGIYMRRDSHSNKSLFIRRLSCQELLFYPLARQPSLFRNEPPGKQRKDCHCAHNHRCIVKRRARHGEFIWRVEYRDHPPVPQDGNGLKGLAPTTQAPGRLGESLGRKEEPTDADEPVGCGGGNTCG